MTEEKKTALKERLLRDIHAGKVAMTPRLYFTLKLAALAGTAAAILLVTVFIVNFIFFSIRINSHEALLGFGPSGWEAFVRFFPWPLLLVDIALIMLLQYLLRNFRFGYSIPVLHLVAGLILGAVVVGFALDRGTPFNDRMHEGRDRLPKGVRGFYDGARKPPPPGSGICRCTILAIEGNTLTVEDTRNATSTLTVVLPLDNKRATTTGLVVGDIVFIAGEEKDGVIQAFGVRKEGDGPRKKR